MEMRSALPLAVFSMTGCDLVFGLGDRTEPVVDAAVEIDADAPVVIDAEIPCQRTTGTVVAIADTTLIPDPGTCDPSIRFGDYRNANIGQQSAGGRSRILARFSLLPDMRLGLSGNGFESATLAIPLKPLECSGVACVSAPITLTVYAATSRWNEGLSTGNIGAGWCMREQFGPGTGMRWVADGANGVGTDRRGQKLVEITMTAAQAAGDTLEIPLAPSAAFADLANWYDDAQLSLLVVPSGPAGTVFTKTKEHPGGGGIALQVTTCR
jgi:hypothetical protein